MLEHGAVHATDYINYIRRNGHNVPRAVGDECNRRNWHRFPMLFPAYGESSKMKRQEQADVLHIYQKMAELEYFGNRQLPISNNMDIAISYLEKKIDVEKWKALIIKRDKQNTFDTEIAIMKNAYFHGLSDIFNRFVLHASERDKIVKEIFGFHRMMLAEFNNLATAFKSKRKAPF